MRITRIRIFYQADPTGVIPGGIDTFIRGLVKWAPADLAFSLVGMTTDPVRRPVGRWTRCSLGRREFDFFPVFFESNPAGRLKVPLTVRLCWHAARYGPEVMSDFDVLELHRLEPMVLFLGDPRPKNAFFHQHSAILRNPRADTRWKRFPNAYYWLENRLVPRLASGFCVNKTGVMALRGRFPGLSANIDFVPTWVDCEVFRPELDEYRRAKGRAEVRRTLGIGQDTRIVATVGRIDRAKDPDLLLDAFNLLVKDQEDVTLVFVGDGVLREPLEARVRSLSLEARVRFLGLRPQNEIATLLRAVDVFALSSAYEGMPMAVLEALGSGIPVVAMDVGEVRRVVSETCGAVVTCREPRAFKDALWKVLQSSGRLAGSPCLNATNSYSPAAVLEPVYENYRRLGGQQTVDRANRSRVTPP